MKILYINHYAGSPATGMEYRPYYLAHRWTAAGHSVTIVAASYAHTRHSNPVVHGPITREDIDGIHYVWLRTPSYHSNGARRLLNMGAFVLSLYRFLPSICRLAQPDVVIASSTYPLDFYPARRIARRCKAKLVFELHDLWPLTLVELGGYSPWNPIVAATQRAEDAWCRDCDLAVSILPNADQHLVTRGLDPRKYFYVPNGIDLADWQGSKVPLPPEHRAFLERKRAQGRFLVGYVGAHGIANALDALVDASRHLGDDPIDLVLVGTGPERHRLISHARKSGLKRVTFLPAIAKAAIPAWLEGMDCLCLCIQGRPLYRFGVSPNKLFDYMMAGKPVIYATNAGNDPVAEAGCGVSVRAEDPDAIAQGIRQLYRTPPEERLGMGRRGREYITSRHSYEALAARFLEAVEHAPMGPAGASEKTGLTPLEALVKRLLDLLLAIVLLSLVWWVILLAWAGAALSTGANGFFLQERIGRWGRPFKVVKIRTMTDTGRTGTTITTAQDPRITKFGMWLRRTKIDELPQLFNVLAGQMSFVGPRPDVPGFADRLEGEERAILSLRAGITGPATLRFRNEEQILAHVDDPEEYNRTVIFPAKVKLNLDYLRNYRLRTDFKYILLTVFGR